ncbi:Anthranilate synthase component 1 [Nitrospira tepida]|uniref:Anthranilate synthase component 1 n=1 Tax=Nitrospira tepida TaxID=2973512 RepID=A0AA86N2F5_9BACT|nr:anthranilate synthase component I family protein [Nitrospira tepida]CAI4033449.1 Anthranilate synthase component 1 [Nitrospira tepida]
MSNQRDTIILPTRAGFLSGAPQPLVLTCPLPAADPYRLYRRIARKGEPSFLLESGAPTTPAARYSFFGSSPSHLLRGKNGTAEVIGSDRRTCAVTTPLAALSSLLSQPTLTVPEDLPPFAGGAVGYLGYDLVRQYEPLPDQALNDWNLPDIQLGLFDLTAAIDHHQQTLHVIFAPSWDRFAGEDRDKLFAEGLDRVEALHACLVGPTAKGSQTHPEARIERLLGPAVPGQSVDDYVERVERCQEYIRAGDIYQANLSHRFHFALGSSTRSPSRHHDVGRAIYERLRVVNPSPFSALLSFGDLTLVSCSPERLIQVHGQTVTTRPIAGTRPRSGDPTHDERLRQELLANAKERAEHTMLVDLERNDLGRVCRCGSVRVNEFMTVEEYSHVRHLVSNVTGMLRPGIPRLDLIKSVFPGGTITGVPKIRCMQIIEELEPVRRGPYTGSLGYFSRTGAIDLNIVIRTMVLTEQSAYLQVGAGIVADSEPSREYQETLDKAQAFFTALHKV